MPHPSSLVCKTAAPASPPAVEPPSPPPAAKHRGNPNLALVPRCGARTRAGCPCRAPAISGKLRCRMHGGRSTGPRTAEGMARLRAARTTHGGYSADSRAFNRHHVTFMRRGRVRLAAVLYLDRLPPDLAARMTPIAPELLWPPRPTRGITRAEDRILLQAETEALAPWKLAIAQARQARRAGRAGTAERCGALTAAQAGPLARNRLPLPQGEGEPPLSSPRQRRQDPMHQFGRPPPRLRRNRCRGAAVRQWWQNPMHQIAPHAVRAAPRRRPGWRRGWRCGQKPMHQNGRPARLPPPWRLRLPLRRQRGQNPLHQFRRPPPGVPRTRRLRASVRNRRQNPMHQN
ncbi:MAG: HGGxSTG domain-containing protein, partial [Acetobacteraceae bacterium]